MRRFSAPLHSLLVSLLYSRWCYRWVRSSGEGHRQMRSRKGEKAEDLGCSMKKDTSLVAFEMKSKIFIMTDYGLHYMTLPLLSSLICCRSFIPLLVSATFTLCSLKFICIPISFSLANSHPSFQVQLQCHLLGKAFHDTPQPPK